MVKFMILLFFISNGNLKLYRHKLDSLSRELEKVRKEKMMLEKEKYGVMEFLEKLNQEEEVLKELLEKIKAQISFMEEEKEKKLEIINKIRKYLEKSREDIKRGIIFLYKRRNISPLHLILYGGSPYTFYAGLKSLNEKFEEEKMILKRGIDLLKEIEERVESLKVRENTLLLLKENFEKREEELVKIKSEKTELLEKLKKDERDREKLLAELRENMERLNQIIRNLEKERKKIFAGEFPKNIPRRNFLWPCDGKVYSSFGTIWHPLYKTKIKNNGVDILSEDGARVKAAGSGIVEYASNFLGYGKLVIIDHGDGFFTIYGNLKEVYVKAGSSVAEGEIIGLLGKDPLENLPLLHFEIRYGGKAVDPLYFLKEAL